MKKKIVTLLAGALLTTALAGNAMAAFESLELTRIAYGTTNEVATDLGSVTSLLARNNDILSSGTSNFVSMGAGATGAGSSVWATYYAADMNSGALYFSAQKGLGSITMDTNNAPNAVPNLDAGINAYYSNLTQTANADGTSSAVGTRGNYASFFSTFEGSAPGFGSFGGAVNASTIKTDVSLAGAAVQGLYYWDGSSATATEVATIATNSDGSTTINPTSTPIPPAIFLMGSGLLGMVGLRRKKS